MDTNEFRSWNKTILSRALNHIKVVIQ